MPLQKQLISAPFIGGVDTGTDPKQLQIGALSDLQNGQFIKKGLLSKRYGYDVLPTQIEGGGNITKAVAISTFNNQLNLFDGSRLYSFLEATATWIDRGPAVSVIATDREILRTGNREQLNPDVGQLSGVQVHAWEDSTGGIRYSVSDAESGGLIVSDALVYEFGQRPKVISWGGQLRILYTDAINNIFYNSVNPFNPTVLGPQVNIVVDGYADLTFDAVSVGSKLFLGYLSSGDGYASGEVKVTAFDDAMASLGSVTLATGSQATQGGAFCIGLAGDTLSNVWAVWGTGAELRAAIVSNSLTSVLADTLIDTGINPQTVTLIEQPGNLGIASIAYEVFAADTINEQIRIATLNRATGAVGTVGTIRSVGLASKAFAVGTDLYVNTAFDSPLQATYFTVQISAAPFPIVAKISSQVGGGLRTNGMLSESVQTSTGVFLWANSIKEKSQTEALTEFSFLGVNSTSLDFDNSNKFLSVVQSNSLLFVGGVLQTYDGVSVVESGFNVYPESIQAVAGGSGSGLASGSYQYVCTYEYTDNNGQTQYSAGSVPVSVTVTAGQHVTVTGPTLRLTSKQMMRSSPNIGIYRTQANGTTFNRVSSILAPLANDPTVDSFQFVDVASDASISSNGLLYTTGGVLDNIAPPACKIISLSGDRVFTDDHEDSNVLWFSKARFDLSRFNSIPVEFAAENTLGVDPRGGAITAIAPMQSNLIIFKSTAIFALSGDGPNDAGGGNPYSPPQLVAADVGCNNPNSIAQTPVGLMFQSSKGIYLIPIDLSGAVYIGKPVEKFNGETISSATLNTASNQIVFTTEGGTALVYDYFFQQWSTWTNHPAVDSDVYQGKFCYVRPNGVVYVQNTSVFTDGPGVPVSLSWTSPDLSLSALQGYGRVFRMYLLGNYAGPHTLKIEVAYDGNRTFTQTCTVDASQDVSIWGGDSFWGESTPWGGTYQPYQFRIDFAQQKCTSIRIRVSDAQSSNYNEGYSVSAVTFEVGALPGGNRVSLAKTKGTK